nr:hypothetical protein HK105_001950 [Polyrhizophydium stewartii]
MEALRAVARLYLAVPWLTVPLSIVGLLALATYLVPCALQMLLPSQNLKRRYSAEWALVTGGSSGIGLAIADRLASEGVSVVIAALDDDLLKSATKTLRAKYPAVQVRSVGVNLASKDFMDKIKSATSDIDVAMLFNNTGYIKPGFFANATIESVMANFDVNASCTLPITHHFVRKMQDRGNGRRSLVCFTSSSGGFLPAPMSAIYSSTKAWVTNFGASLAGEVAEDKIEVLVVHPSPIASNFYQNANGMSVLQAVEKSAAAPSVVSDAIWKCAGRTVIVDQGSASVGIKVLLRVLEWNLLADLFTAFVSVSGDYQRFRKQKRA